MKAAVLLGLLALPVTLSAQSSGAPKRLIAQARYENTPAGYQLQDSAHYTYSAQRGSRFDPNFLLYTDLQVLGSQPDADFVNQRIPTHNIDSIGLPRSDYDTAFFGLGLTQAPPNSLRSHEGHRYGANGEITAVFNRVFDPLSGAQQYGQHSIEVYTGGRLTRSYILGFNGVSYDTSFIRDFAYNGAGQLVLDSLSYRLLPGSYLGYRKITYAYGSSSGYLSSTLYGFQPSPSRLEPLSRDSLHYYPDGRLQQRKRFFMGDSGNFLPETLDSFGYSAGIQGFDYLREEELDTLGNPVYTYLTVTNHVNSRGQKDSMTFTSYRGATMIGNNRIGIVYDADGYPLSRSDYFSNTGPTPFAIEYYYYEPIPQIGSSVQHTSPQLSFALAPNPCRENLNYTLEGIPAGSTVRLEVLTLQGQLVRRETRSWTGIPQQLVLGPEAPAGQYILRVTEARSGAGSSRQFTRL